MVLLTLLLMTKKRLFMKGVRFEWVSMKGNLLFFLNPDKTLKWHISMSRRKGNPIYAKKNDRENEMEMEIVCSLFRIPFH